MRWVADWGDLVDIGRPPPLPATVWQPADATLAITSQLYRQELLPRAYRAVRPHARVRVEVDGRSEAWFKELSNALFALGRLVPRLDLLNSLELDILPDDAVAAFVPFMRSLRCSRLLSRLLDDVDMDAHHLGDSSCVREHCWTLEEWLATREDIPQVANGINTLLYV